QRRRWPISRSRSSVSWPTSSRGRATVSSCSAARCRPRRRRAGPKRSTARPRSRRSARSLLSTGSARVKTRAVIFDMDGVLVDSGAHHREAWQALLDELGVVPAERDYWRLTIGRPSVEAVPLLLGRAMSWAEAQRLAARKQEHYRRLAAAGPVLV